jgi:hypothetical protein
MQYKKNGEKLDRFYYIKYTNLFCIQSRKINKILLWFFFCGKFICEFRDASVGFYLGALSASFSELFVCYTL